MREPQKGCLASNVHFVDGSYNSQWVYDAKSDTDTHNAAIDYEFSCPPGNITFCGVCIHVLYQLESSVIGEPPHYTTFFEANLTSPIFQCNTGPHLRHINTTVPSIPRHRSLILDFELSSVKSTNPTVCDDDISDVDSGFLLSP